MSVFKTAGNTLLAGGQGLKGPPGYAPVSTLGVRSLREEYLKPVHKNSIPNTMRLIEESLERDAMQMQEPVASDERLELPRFQHLFQGGELLPPGVFIAALELGNSEKLNGRQMQYDTDVLVLRDNLVMAYKPLLVKIRQLNAKEIQDLPRGPVLSFCRSWTAWESAWLRNREVHAVEALQPLAKAILSLEPLLLSAEKERLLPWPRVQHQKAVTLKCLEGFVHSLSVLAATVLPSLARELDHDSRLLLLMEHVLSLRGDTTITTCLEGLSSAPDVAFPDHQGHGKTWPSAGASFPATGAKDGARGVPLDRYAFKLLGSSVGDAVAAGKVRSETGIGQAGRYKMAYSMGADTMDMNALADAPSTSATKESRLSRKAALHAVELLDAFEGVKDVLLSLKSTLERIDPALDRDEVFVGYLQRFERAFRRSKKLFLEPENLA
mmetsp:Transcript_48719/g.139325  ORF Transcript_48719/g.139325 Transcript_48719/m.139325 type:complete len:439 (+) Transcript_48719:86-1402(+)